MAEKKQARQDVSEEAVQHDLLTLTQVQARLQLDRDRVYALVRAGTIPSVRLGRGIRIPRLAYERWLATLGAA